MYVSKAAVLISIIMLGACGGDEISEKEEAILRANMPSGLSYDAMVNFESKEVSPRDITLSSSNDDYVIEGGEDVYVLKQIDLASSNDNSTTMTELKSNLSGSTSFWIGSTEVPQWLWRSVMSSNPSVFQDPLLPVHTITLDEACMFTSRLSGKLEAEFSVPPVEIWEFAAEDHRNDHPKFNAPVHGFGWNINSDGPGIPRIGGLLDANRYGLNDIYGNVSEWTTLGGCGSGRGILKGGGWGSNTMYLVGLKKAFNSEFRHYSNGLRIMMRAP